MRFYKLKIFYILSLISIYKYKIKFLTLIKSLYNFTSRALQRPYNINNATFFKVLYRYALPFVIIFNSS